MATRAKRHHQVPQCYLRNFANSKNRLVVFDRVKQVRRTEQLISQVAVVSNLYTVSDEKGLPSDIAESQLAEFESKASAALIAFLEPNPTPGIEETCNMALFVAMQFLRTEALRDLIEDNFDLNHRMQAEINIGGDPAELVEKYIEQRYSKSPPWLHDQIRLIAIDPSQPNKLPNEEWISFLFEHSFELAETALRRNWWLADRDERSFLTCDNPVMLTWSSDVPEGGTGFVNAGEIILPLSPFRSLVMGDVCNRSLVLSTVDSGWTKWASVLASKIRSDERYND